MTAAKLAELLREAADYTRHPDYDWPVEFSRRVAEALAANEVAQAEEVCPVGEIPRYYTGFASDVKWYGGLVPAPGTKLYTRPAQPLTPEQRADLCEAWLQAGGAGNIVDAYEAGFRGAERAHGITKDTK